MSLRKNWATFPLYPVLDAGRCGCLNEECKAVGKHPAYSYSLLGKGEQIAGREGCGYGIATGERSGIIVLDFDNLDALETIERERGLPPTYTVKTPRGAHLYFKWPGFRVKNSASELAPGVDVRGDGGFVVAAGSPHKTGALYEELPEVQEVAIAPYWLLSWPGLKGVDRTPRESGTNAPVPVDMNSAKGLERVRMATDFLNSAAPCLSGQINAEGRTGGGQLWHVALYLVRDLELPLDVCATVLTEGDESYNARCEPPWSDAEIWHKLEDARDRSDRVPGAVDMSGYQARAEEEWDRQNSARREARAATVTPDAPHAYTFDPCNVVREAQYVEAEDGSKKAKKPYKPDIDELVFDLSTEDDWAGVFRYNEFDDRVYANRPPFAMAAERGVARLSDEDLTGLRIWFLNKKHMSAKPEDLASAVNLIARRNSYHPVREWLGSLPSATTRHLDNLASVLFGDTRAIAQEYLRKQLVAACARAFEPGCRVDTVLTLCGPKGGEQKSTTIRELHAVPGCNTFRTDLPDLRNFQLVGQAVEGVWVVELPELAVAKKSDVETLKATITRTEERYSPKYIKGEILRPRGFVLWASTNEEHFLPRADPALRRRFWTIYVLKRVDLAWLAEHRAEIWAEAMSLYRAGGDEAWWFRDEDRADAGRQDFVAEDSWEALARAAFERLEPTGESERETLFTGADVYYLINGSKAPAPTNADMKKVAEAMSGLPYRKKKTETQRGWLVPRKK